MKSELNVVANRYGWRFYQKLEARTCFFVNLELTFALFFFIFCFDFIYQSSSYNLKVFEGKGVDLEEGGFRKVCGFLKQKKEISNPFQLFFCFKNPYSFLDLILWVLKITLRIFSMVMQRFQVIFNTYKNNEKIIRSASAAAQSKCIIFLFADWDVSDCFCGKVDAIDLKER